MAGSFRSMLVNEVELVGTDYLNRGSFGVVRECVIDGTDIKCAGKTIRQTGWSNGNERVKFEAKYAFVCHLMSRLNHCNVVKFLGVTLLPGDSAHTPTMLMELMMTDLHYHLEETPSIPFLHKISFLYDIARGMAYLHSLSIVHGDLTAKNVLLSYELVPKIADFDTAWILDGQRAQAYLFEGSPEIIPPEQHGTEVYMPPEVDAGYFPVDYSLDVFSFGHLALFIVLQVSASRVVTVFTWSLLSINQLL